MGNAGEGETVSKELEYLKPIPKTAEGLRDALFEEINLLRAGKSTPQKARVVANLASQIIDSMRVQIQHGRMLLEVDRRKPMQLGSES